MIKFKLFLQNLWKKNNSWDQALDQEDKETWKSLTKEWPTDVIELPKLATNFPEQQQLHVFTDVSKVAYSAAIYILNQHVNGKETALLFAKSRLASIKDMSIPRLKLLTILTGVRAAKFVRQQLNLEEIPVFLWSDSKYALHWEYQFTGEYEDEEEPKKEEQFAAKVAIQAIEEIRSSLIDGSRFSAWSKLVRITIWVLKFIKRTTKGKIIWLQAMSTEAKQLSSEDFKLAEWVLIKQARTWGSTKKKGKNGIYTMMTRIYGDHRTDWKIWN
ncbi:unnamed protein product [Onchocerca ochengi]|uniref:RT_RNaseH_2 domain-containing protein n=1 Tax=Onchocerca ochengi TaxID=42157 RepID=A0A182EPP3_ONCOC|nr:unnamed protein product [Onchocerca ochengi]